MLANHSHRYASGIDSDSDSELHPEHFPSSPHGGQITENLSAGAQGARRMVKTSHLLPEDGEDRVSGRLHDGAAVPGDDVFYGGLIGAEHSHGVGGGQLLGYARVAADIGEENGGVHGADLSQAWRLRLAHEGWNEPRQQHRHLAALGSCGHAPRQADAQVAAEPVHPDSPFRQELAGNDDGRGHEEEHGADRAHSPEPANGRHGGEDEEGQQSHRAPGRHGAYEVPGHEGLEGICLDLRAGHGAHSRPVRIPVRLADDHGLAAVQPAALLVIVDGQQFAQMARPHRPLGTDPVHQQGAPRLQPGYLLHAGAPDDFDGLDAAGLLLAGGAPAEAQQMDSFAPQHGHSHSGRQQPAASQLRLRGACVLEALEGQQRQGQVLPAAVAVAYHEGHGTDGLVRLIRHRGAHCPHRFVEGRHRVLQSHCSRLRLGGGRHDDVARLAKGLGQSLVFVLAPAWEIQVQDNHPGAPSAQAAHGLRIGKPGGLAGIGLRMAQVLVHTRVTADVDDLDAGVGLAGRPQRVQEIERAHFDEAYPGSGQNQREQDRQDHQDSGCDSSPEVPAGYPLIE